jgi:hypothetical protein
MNELCVNKLFIIIENKNIENFEFINYDLSQLFFMLILKLFYKQKIYNCVGI